MSHTKNFIPRDVSWLSFNGRVLQEANDPSVPLRERIRFLGIHSNNQDEFFRVRVATLKRMVELMKKGGKQNMHLEASPEQILDEIQKIVLQQQNEFSRIWNGIVKELKAEKIFLVTEKQLNKEQQKFVERFYDEEVSPNIIPLMIESIVQMPYLREKSLYLGVVMQKKESAYKQKYALIEIPANAVGRFVLLPSKGGEQHIILLEDVIRYNLPHIFSFFGYDEYSAHIFNVTKDAEIDIDNDIATSLIQKIEKGIKKRRMGKPVRFVYDREMDAGLLEYLIRRLNLARKDNVVAGGRIHNYRHFVDFPDVFGRRNPRKQPFVHPDLDDGKRVTDVVMQQDVMLHFPYHSFIPVIDLLREAAIDPDVTNIKITCYRLAGNSKIMNALINAVRNGKQVEVMLELKARFDEENNLYWKERLEEEGVKVLVGIDNMKVHAKICMIRKKVKTKIIHYGFVSTGNMNEKTATIYGDHCLLTSNRLIMADINRMFRHLEKPFQSALVLRQCKTLMVCPVNMRREILAYIAKEIKTAKAGKPASIILKVNSLSDNELILKLYEAAQAGVAVKAVIRGICCAVFDQKKFKEKPQAVSIVDEYLEHARVMVFGNEGKTKVFISSADWMVRNLDHRVEAACPIFDPAIKKEIIDILEIQLKDNVKARVLDNSLSNDYVQPARNRKKIRSQIETYNYLYQKKLTSPMHPRFGIHAAGKI
ncbi:MAG: polyphosphate kinase 1 [Chitinophagaceae bacterium]